MLHIFLDESGIHKQTGISCVALVYVEVENIESLGQMVMDAETELGIENFHWSKTNWVVRNKFLDEIRVGDFLVKVGVVRNPFSASDYGEVLKHFTLGKKEKVLVIDGKKSLHYRKAFKKTLRDQGILLKKLVMGNDKSYPPLRIADFCAGLVRNLCERPMDKTVQKFYKKITSKIIISDISK